MSHFPQREPSYLHVRDPSILKYRGDLEKVRQNLRFSSISSIGTTNESYTFAVPQEEVEEFSSKLVRGFFLNILLSSMDLTRDLTDDCIEIFESASILDAVGVYLRIKGGGPPNALYKFEENVLTCALPQYPQPGRNVRGNRVYNKYSFTKIFGPETTQSEIFDNTIKSKVFNFMKGENCTLLAYGVSGSGKTYTMMGTADDPGVIPRSLDYLFRSLAPVVNEEPIGKPLPDGKLETLTKSDKLHEMRRLQQILQEARTLHDVQGKSYRNFDEMERRLSVNQVAQLLSSVDVVGVWVAFAEIYNEMIYDLLVPMPSRGAHRNILKLAGLQSDTYIKGLTWIYVRSGAEAYQVMQYGLQNLSYAGTSINEHSSRSHSIFSVKLVSGFDSKKCKVSVLNFADLAGSERQKKTNNVGSRLVESTKINSSLMVLGRCIKCVRNRQQNKDCTKAPFRESKLTHLLQKALQGKEDISMIVNINPSPTMFEDTQFALKFSAIAREIVVNTEPNPSSVPVDKPYDICKPITDEEWKESLEKEQLLKENSELRDQVALLTLHVSELTVDFQEENLNIRRQYEAILQVKNERIKELEKIEKLHNKKELEEINKRTREQLRRAFGQQGDNDNLIVISDDELSETSPNTTTTTENSAVYTDSDTSNYGLFLHRSVNEHSSEKEGNVYDHYDQ